MPEREFDPAIAKELNDQGFESGDEGGAAAVRIVPKEEQGEMATAARREGYKTGGEAVNLETYIRMHKEIVIPAEEAKKLARRGKLSKEPLEIGGFFFEGLDGDKIKVLFVDKDKNVARVTIDVNKVAELKAKYNARGGGFSVMHTDRLLKEDFPPSFAYKYDRHPFTAKVGQMLRDYNAAEAQRRLEKREEDFNF